MSNIYETITFNLAEGDILKIIGGYEVRRFNKGKKFTMRLLFEVLESTGTFKAGEISGFFVEQILIERLLKLQSQSVVWNYMRLIRGSSGNSFKYQFSSTRGLIEDENVAFENALRFDIQRLNKNNPSTFYLRGIPKSWEVALQSTEITQFEDLFIKKLEMANKLTVRYIGSTLQSRYNKIIACTLQRGLEIKKPIKKKMKGTF